jgi:DNA polymerase
VHGTPQDVTLGGNAVTLYPLYHPAAALYTRSMLSVLEEDFARIPTLLGRAACVPATQSLDDPPPEPEPVREPQLAVQLGLF